MLLEGAGVELDAAGLVVLAASGTSKAGPGPGAATPSGFLDSTASGTCPDGASLDGILLGEGAGVGSGLGAGVEVGCRVGCGVGAGLDAAAELVEGLEGLDPLFFTGSMFFLICRSA